MVWVYFFYQEKRYKIVKRDFRKKIEDLSKLKQKTIENIDALLMKINFYENSKIALYEPDKEFVWTSEKKEDFILKTFKLTEFSEISKSYKEYLEKDDKTAWVYRSASTPKSEDPIGAGGLTPPPSEPESVPPMLPDVQIPRESLRRGGDSDLG